MFSVIQVEMISDLMYGIGFFSFDINKSNTNQPFGLFSSPTFKKTVLDPSNVDSAAATVARQLTHETASIEVLPVPVLLPFR